MSPPRRKHEDLTRRARPPGPADVPPDEEADREGADGAAVPADRKVPKGRPAVELAEGDDPLPPRTPWLPPARR